MRFHPYSLAQAPQVLPVWQSLVMDLGNPHPREIAKVLSLGTRTVYRYNRTGQAPRVACLALYWLTRWGRSQVATQAANDVQVIAGYASSLEVEVDRLRSELHRVMALNGSGAANDAIQREAAYVSRR